ncbi:MAG: flippase-like domain-containing protein [Clostridia bacterium]|nr:flippase-like domain-containing protein [Clostridia bacterium]
MKNIRIPWKRMLSILYILVTITVVLIIGVTNNSFAQLGEAFRNFDGWWLALMVACVAGYYLMENYTLWYYLDSEKHTLGFWTSLKVTMIGQYYSALTPFASGGQPVQVYYMHKHGVPVGIGTSAMTVKMILFNIAMVSMGIVGFVINFNYFVTKAPAALPFGIIGLFLNSALIVFFWVMFFNKNFSRRVVRFIAKLLSKIHIVKNLEKTYEKIDSVLEEYFVCIEFIKKNPKKMVWLFFATLFQTACLMSVSYCIYRAFGLSGFHPLQFIALQYLHYIAVSYVPLPGASGAQEGGFVIFFGGILPDDKTYIVMIIWRFFTYFVSIISGGAVVVWETVRGFIPKDGELNEDPKPEPDPEPESPEGPADKEE